MKKLIIVILLIFVVFNAYCEDNHSYKPKEGYIPDKETAIKIAEAVWFPIYGKAIDNERPFVVVLKDGIWIVKGSLPKAKSESAVLGGTAIAEISKDDGRILRVSHGQ